ncbi:MAG: hypothetical protein FD163_2520 [Hyphomonadaceae bacterium]|nr:MAG: hypothetical protein FD128_747 [Hyphomonadaceae bacterium]KAF0182730.1 MAG: hypothetical protein FD163_2520 [Hyphomonadaceae bacterium]
MTLQNPNNELQKRMKVRGILTARQAIMEAFLEEQNDDPKITQSAIACALGVNKSSITREFRGMKNFSVGRLAEIAWAMGRKLEIELAKPNYIPGHNFESARVFSTSESRENISRLEIKSMDLDVRVMETS